MKTMTGEELIKKLSEHFTMPNVYGYLVGYIRADVDRRLKGKILVDKAELQEELLDLERTRDTDGCYNPFNIPHILVMDRIKKIKEILGIEEKKNE